MCGIAGFNWPDEKKALAMVSSFAHRGPDGVGVFSDIDVSFGHCRLAILDTSEAGHQPMLYHPESGGFSANYKQKVILPPKLVVTYNGEIYNYTELKGELRTKGYKFSTRCDTELLLAAYLEWGRDCVKKFNGMWAFCVYDMEKKELFLSRDRLGIKPLYYFLDKKGRFVFSSQLSAFSVHNHDRSLDSKALSNYFVFGYTPSGQSIFEDIKKLEPGCNLIYDLLLSEVSHETYWKPEAKIVQHNPRAAFDGLNDLLSDSVQKRLLSDVPVGAFLSGGLDSSILTALMRPHVDKLKTFSVRFDHPEFDESAYAQLVARHLETEHHEICFGPADVKALIEVLPAYFDEPFADASMIPTYLVAAVASKEVKVCLSGTGADELFAGYDRYKEYLLLRKLHNLPRCLKSLICSSGLLSNDRAGKLKQLLLYSGKDELYPKLLSHLFRHDNEKSLRNDQIVEDVAKMANGDLDDILLFDQKVYLPEDLLVKEDRATMAHGLEGRVPFLDYRVVEFANSLPPSLKIHAGCGKYALKKTFGHQLPIEIINRPKKGFGVPIKHYFKNELREFIRELVFDNFPLDCFEKDEIQKLWHRHQEGQSDYSPLFWNLALFSFWHQRYCN